MASLRSPSASHLPSQSKKGVFSSSTSSRRPSTSSNAVGNSSPQIPQGIGYSPGPTNTPTTPAGSGIPAFRTLRSLLPFGPGKNATPVSASASPNTSRSPFSNFGSVRRSMTRERERKSSLSNDAMSSVIAIGPVADELGVRRSVSLSRLEEPLPPVPLFNDGPNTVQDTRSELGSAFVLRTPSPGPALSAELSTIIEADSSGVSKRVLLGITPQGPPSNSHSKQLSHGLEDEDADNSALDLSTSHLADQVRDAMLGNDATPSAAKQWRGADKEVVIIDADEHPEADTTFALDSADPDLLALLSPNAVSKAQATQSSQPSPTTPTFPSSSTSRLPRSRPSLSLLPRPRASNSPSPSPISRNFPIPSPSPTTTATLVTPKPSPAKGGALPAVVTNGSDYSPTSPSASLASLASASSSTPARRRTMGLARPAKVFNHSASTSLSESRTNMFTTPGKSGADPTQANSSSTMNGSRLAARTLRQVMLGMSTRRSPKSDKPSSPSVELMRPRASLDLRRPPSAANDIGLGRPSLEARRGSSFDSRRPSPMHNSRSSSSPEQTGQRTPDANSSALPEAPFHDARHRPSLDSSRPSFDSSTRPGSSARSREKERHNTPALRVIDASGDGLNTPASPIPRAPPPNRVRKRSMSVQERFGKGRHPGAMADHGSAAGAARPGSSLSMHGRRGSRGGSGAEAATNEFGSSQGPKLEWLGPRTAKAFRAAGLLDFEREKEKERDGSPGSGEVFERSRERGGSVSGMLAPSPLGATSSGNVSSALNRFASLRSASEYNPTSSRAHSRMAFSDAGGGSGRRGSGTFSPYGGGSAYGGISTYGLMESPTFTVSSSSRDRDTPKSSTSTAPTSVSESFGYLGRDRVERERDRDRDDVRELKEKHATEMAALLGALSDSQRTARVLRDENTELRERLDRFAGVVQQNNELRQACGEMQQECSDLHRQCTELRRELAAGRTFRSPSGLAPSWSGSSTSSGLRTPLPRPGNSSPLAHDVTPRFDEEEFNDTMIIHDDLDDRSEDTPRRPTGRHDHDHDDAGSFDAIRPSSSSTPSLKRRLSGASSVFPVPPPNMTMLLDDDAASQLGDSNRSSADHSQYPFSMPPPAFPPSSSSSRPIPSSNPNAQSHTRSPPVSYQTFVASGGHMANKSIASVVSISPTTANFSMVTGSPGSLSLRPEHELLLGDMESLDLGVRGLDLEADLVRTNGDGW